MDAAKAPVKTSLQVLDRAFAVLDLFTSDQPEWTTTAVAREVGLTVPTAHRILRTLRGHGFLARDEVTKRFRLGAAAMALGDRARAVTDIRYVAHPVLARLSEQTGETTLLTVLNERRDRSVCLERVESSQPLRLSVEPGRQLPLHAGASQKILLAYMPHDEIEALLMQPMERFCRATIVNRARLRANLAETRSRGYADSTEETNEGASGFAVAILEPGGSIVAGVGLAGPSARLRRSSIQGYVRRLRGAAAEIADGLGIASHAVPRVEVEA